MPTVLPLLVLPAASAHGPGATATAGSAPNLRDYDLYRAGVSGGKDTWAALVLLRDAAAAVGTLDRLWTDHADLGLAERPA
ncbi:hypothetical protein [Dactylosporangium sp. NPDC049140]|uniref:hypothetical protein n=1 Tax=Dactylosporangium sp. NPDC049140 TaxID=3155647 RepID=UPI0033CA0AF5